MLQVISVYRIMPELLCDSRGNGWRIVEISKLERPISSNKQTFDEGTVVVIRSEGQGVQTLFKHGCDVDMK